MAALLLDIAERRLMLSIGTDACGWAEGNKVKAVLSFMKQTMTDEEFKVLRDLKEDKTKKTVKQVCADVEARWRGRRKGSKRRW